MLFFFLAALLFGAPATAQQPPGPRTSVMTRDAQGRASIHATRLAQPLRIDGTLDEPFYASVEGMGDFVQVEPKLGDPATEKTEVWVAYDADNVYIAFKCWENEPGHRVSTEMRRDGQKIFGGDDIAYFYIDTFHDQRNGYSFSINSLGAFNDGAVSNDQYLGDWNPVFRVATGSFDQGWTVEVALPFKSIRYGSDPEQTWGFNALRTVRWRNEYSVLSPAPPWNGLSAARQGKFAAQLTGVQVPVGLKNLEVKPYGISSLTTDLNARPTRRNDGSADAGIDVKYAITPNVIADFTYNTDFAQVEADEQQVNLTRFNLFFPEKRDFFLENQGTFSTFGGATPSSTNDTPVLFYSRRIGLDAGRPVKINGGGRLSGRVGRTAFGLMDIDTDVPDPAAAGSTNFTVARVRQDVFRRSTVGLLYTGRSGVQPGGTLSQAVGLDGTFSFFNFLTLNSYWAKTEHAGRGSDDQSYRGQLVYAGDRYGAQLEQLSVGRDFAPDVGFVRRTDIRRSYAQFRFSPRPTFTRRVRKFSYTGSFAYVQNGAGRVENRQSDGEFAIEFQNADRLAVYAAQTYEYVPRPFRVAPNVTVPVGGYTWNNVTLGYNLGTQRTVAANFLLEHGTFYGGHRTAFSASRGRLSLGPRFSVEPTYTVNWLDLPAASATTHLLGSRVTYTMTPRMFASALIQYNSITNSVATNARLRWEYLPGSELFVVYNDERDTRFSGFPGLMTRSFIVKVNRLFRF